MAGHAQYRLMPAGCAIGDLGTIYYFQVTGIGWPVWAIMSLAIVNGLITSVALKQYLTRQWLCAPRSERPSHVVDFHGLNGSGNEPCRRRPDRWCCAYLVGCAAMLIAGYVTQLPYNYWRLKAHGKACH